MPLSFGWANLITNSIWHIFLYLSNLIYTIGILFIVCRWSRKTLVSFAQSKTIFINVVILVLLVIGVLAQTLLFYGADPVLQLVVPIIVLFPVTAFFHLIIKFGLISKEQISTTQVIINDQTRRRMYSYLTFFFIGLSVLSFAYEWLLRPAADQWRTAAVRSGILIIIGLLLHLFQRLKKDNMRFCLNTDMVLLSIPVVSALFIKYGTISWAFPIVLIIFTFVFNRPHFLITVSVTAIVSQLIIWVYQVHGPGYPSIYSLATKIFFYFVFFILGLYINQIYVAKLKENTFQIDLQKLIADISCDFARIDIFNMDQYINSMLAKTGVFFNADRCYIFLIDDAKSEVSLSYEWCCTNITPASGLVKPCPWSEYSQFFDKMSDHHTVYIEDARKLPDGFIKNNGMIVDKDIISLVSAPIETNGSMYGFIGISTVSTPLILSSSSLEALQTFANFLADKFMMLKAEKAIERLAFYDQLTELPNRLLFNDRMVQAIHLCRRTEKFLGLVFMDLDCFKTINDTMGHSGGDAIIKEIAQALSHRVRKSDTVARFGGDEFLILLNDIADYKQIPQIAEKVMNLFASPIKLRDQEYFVTASAGISVYPFDGEDCATLIKNADSAMYQAKAKGANSMVMCTSAMKEEVQRNIILSNSLYRALERNEFKVVYQPQVSLSSGRIVGFEALLRWHHPQLGVISPGLFIPLSEKNGLINGIGEWVLKTACIQNKKWQDMGYPTFRMSVNLSVLQFRNPRLVETVESILNETGLKPECLEMEITESAAVSETSYIMTVLRSLKNLGVTISIDDFGMEYSSLKRLKELPVDRIKIDIQFIKGLENNEKDQAITMIIINLAKNLGLHVIAEGVETQPQLQFLKNRQCDEVQGYYFYKPMPPDKVTQLLENSTF